MNTLVGVLILLILLNTCMVLIHLLGAFSFGESLWLALLTLSLGAHYWTHYWFKRGQPK
jgi:hypothetical protein